MTSQNHIAGRVSGPIGIQLRLLSERYGDSIVLEIDGVAGGRVARRPEQTTGRSLGPNRPWRNRRIWQVVHR